MSDTGWSNIMRYRKRCSFLFIFFFNDTATTEIYTLSLHDALPIYVNDLTVRGVLDGLRASRTIVSSEPPAYGGAQAFLEADRNRDGSYESMVGDTVKPRTPLRVRVVDAPGAYLQIVTDGGTPAGPPVLVKGTDFEYRFKLPPRDTWAFAEVYGEDAPAERQAACGQAFGVGGDPTTYCTNHVSMMALTSALYLRR